MKICGQCYLLHELDELYKNEKERIIFLFSLSHPWLVVSQPESYDT